MILCFGDEVGSGGPGFHRLVLTVVVVVVMVGGRGSGSSGSGSSSSSSTWSTISRSQQHQAPILELAPDWQMLSKAQHRAAKAFGSSEQPSAAAEHSGGAAEHLLEQDDSRESEDRERLESTWSQWTRQWLDDNQTPEQHKIKQRQKTSIFSGWARKKHGGEFHQGSTADGHLFTILLHRLVVWLELSRVTSTTL